MPTDCNPLFSLCNIIFIYHPCKRRGWIDIFIFRELLGWSFLTKFDTIEKYNSLNVFTCWYHDTVVITRFMLILLALQGVRAVYNPNEFETISQLQLEGATFPSQTRAACTSNFSCALVNISIDSIFKILALTWNLVIAIYNYFVGIW